MASSAGTLELLARELGLVLGRLEEHLSDDGAEAFFESLGLRPPAGFTAAGGLAAALSSAVTTAAALAPQVVALSAAIEADDPVAIVEAGLALTGTIGDVVGAIDQVADATDAAAATAAGLTPAQRAEVAAFAAALPRRALDALLVEHLAARAPGAVGPLEILGLVDRAPQPGVPGDPLRPPHVRRAFHLDRLPTLATDPAAHLRTAWGWGDPAFDGLALLDALQRYLRNDLEVPAVLLAPPGEPAVLEAYVVAVQVDPAVVPPALVVDLRFPGTADVARTYPLMGPWQMRLNASGRFVADVRGRITPPLHVDLRPPQGDVQLTVTAGIGAESAADPLLLLGAVGGTRLEADAASFDIGLVATWDGTRATAVPTATAELRGGRLVVSLGGADGFLASVLPGGMEVAVDLAATWNPDDGLELRGGAGLAVTVPLALDIGPARLERLDLRFAIGAPGLTLEARATGGIALGPFSASVEGVGAGADLALRPGNLGPLDIGFRFLAPTGLGLAVDAGPIRGGGFIGFDPATGRYSGVFELGVGPVGVTAMGLLDTRMPGGGKGFALLVVLRAEFPPIQLGFGFALSAVGGLLALNRRIDVDVLRARMASGTAGRILAPEDPIRNAPVLLADLAAVFPPTQGVVVLGPTLQLSWVELVRLDLGVFVELPGPSKVVLLGSARMVVPNPAGGRSFLQLRLDIVGLLDFAKQVLEFDAVLVDSHILEILELSGGASFRLSWGAEPYVVLTVGGFHPAWSPAPLVFPALSRIGMSRGSPTDLLYMRFEGYFAVTTNTLQFGAAVEVIINAGPFNARGFLGFDALIRFQPFSFRFDFAASVKVRYRSRTLAGVSLRGTLTGPGPVVFKGKACIEILFFEICWSETITLGSRTPPAVTPVASAVAELAQELEDPAALRSVGGDDPWVVLEPATGLALPVVPPLGQLVWSQERAPLDLLLQRFEGAPLSRPETVRATGPQVTAPEVDWFAPGSFAELSDSDALNRRAFERLHGGVRLGVGGVAQGPSTTHVVTVKQIRLPAPPALVTALSFPIWLLRGVAGRTGVVERDAVVPATAVRDEAWVVRGAGGALVADGVSQAQAHQLATVAGAGTAVPAVDVVASFGF